MDHLLVLSAFGFDTTTGSPPESIYPYAPVYRVEDPAGEWIVKRTQKPAARAQAVAAWTRSLEAGGIPVVTAAAGFGENPRSFTAGEGNEEFWVVYPFIQGRVYSGDLAEMRAAGDLLGRIHMHAAGTEFGLKINPIVVAIEEQEIRGDMDAILGFVNEFFPQSTGAAQEILALRAERYLRTALPRLLTERLPLANCTWDYKASNLVYPGAGLPVLVDPDNAGRIPRAYDLAIAALLFHNDGCGPRRVFDREEWLAFLAGYTRHVRLEPKERSQWEDILLSAWIDEALWLLNGETEDWADPKQGRMLLSLLMADFKTLSLE